MPNSKFITPPDKKIYNPGIFRTIRYFPAFSRNRQSPATKIDRNRQNAVITLPARDMFCAKPDYFLNLITRIPQAQNAKKTQAYSWNKQV
jgi:hypothetical protein